MNANIPCRIDSPEFSMNREPRPSFVVAPVTRATKLSQYTGGGRQGDRKTHSDRTASVLHRRFVALINDQDLDGFFLAMERESEFVDRIE